MAIEQKRIEAAAILRWERGFARGERPIPWDKLSAKAKRNVIRDEREPMEAAFPELASDPPTGWLAPMEATKEMLDAAEDRFEDFKDEGWSSTGDGYRYEYTDIRSGFAHGMYEAARDAHLKEQK